MSMKSFFVLLLLLVAAGWGWHQYGSGLMQRLAPPVAPPPLRFDNDPPRPVIAPATPGALRKCLGKDAQVLYTNGACPEGSREQAVDGGAVTVVPGQRSVKLPTLPAAGGASAATVRDLLGPDNGAKLRDERMEKIIGK